MNNDINFLEKITKYKKDNYKNNFEYKQILKVQLKNKFIKHFPLSNINEQYDFDNTYKYEFDYQRYDSNLEYKNYFERFYNINDLKTKTIFTSSGMSAINSIINTLNQKAKYNIEFSKDIYFETQKLIKMFSIKRAKSKILWLDTISYKYDFDIKNIDRYEIIVIDTTCFHSHLFKELIYKIIKYNKLCILVRSHTKLDMLGLEYCTLGSITYILPHKIDMIQWKKYKEMIIFNLEYIGNSGLGITEYNIFPLLNNEEFILLNKERIERIKSNNNYVYSKLSSNYKFIIPNHSLFILLNIRSNLNLKELKNIIFDFCKKYHNICCFSPSFGFDYIALDTYYDYNMKNYTIRISVGDVDNDIIAKFIEIFLEFINDNF